jgi:hypothetical protein
LGLPTEPATVHWPLRRNQHHSLSRGGRGDQPHSMRTKLRRFIEASQNAQYDGANWVAGNTLTKIYYYEAVTYTAMQNHNNCHPASSHPHQCHHKHILAQNFTCHSLKQEIKF